MKRGVYLQSGTSLGNESTRGVSNISKFTTPAYLTIQQNGDEDVR
jgi:hypothetical protein